MAGASASSSAGYYTLTLQMPNPTAGSAAQSYLLTATRAGAQASDACGNFTYDDQGTRNVTGGSMTWQNSAMPNAT